LNLLKKISKKRERGEERNYRGWKDEERLYQVARLKKRKKRGKNDKK
jgi:hypothetical protein